MSGQMKGPGGQQGWRANLLPLGMLIVSLLYVGSGLRAPGGDEYHVEKFGQIPVVDLGRIKPIDTLARTSLMAISNKQTLWLGEDRATSDRHFKEGLDKSSAVRWLLDVMARPELARQYTVIRIDHPDVLSLIGGDTERMYYSFQEVMEHSEVLSDQINRSMLVEANQRTVFQRNLVRLSQQLNQYFFLEEITRLHLIPPVVAGEEWQTLDEARRESDIHGESHAAVDTYIGAIQAWQQRDAAGFNAAVTSHLGLIEHQLPELAGRGRLEMFFNTFAPFIRAIGLYVLVFLLAVFSWLRLSPSMAKAALWVLLVALVVHTFGLVARIYIQGRPPVTNLYSSAIFVGWGCAVLGVFLERIFRSGIGSVAAAGCGFLSLLVAHNLSLDGDTMTMMQAVLDTNFWLATHVVTITLGYASTFLAGFLGTIYIIRGVLTRSLDRQEARNLSRMIYGIIAFSALFSFIGTVLGGIWADQSWGRFWGWDPKENGALLLVLWNALILHARWSGMARQRGIAILAVAGNIVTAWSWFGTNMLGVGLHAYGFIDSAVFWMLIFVVTQLGLIGVGLIPKRNWRSFRHMEMTPGETGVGAT